MGLKKDEYWWIEKNGILAKNGRRLDGNGRIWESGGPTIEYTKRYVQMICREGERPVKVRITKVEE